MNIVVLGREASETAQQVQVSGRLSDQSWEESQRLAPSTRLRLTLVDLAELEGDFVEARADSITVRNIKLLKGQLASAAGTSPSDPRTFARSEIAALAPSTASKPLPLGAKVGIWAGVGVAVAFLLSALAGNLIQ